MTGRSFSAAVVALAAGFAFAPSAGGQGICPTTGCPKAPRTLTVTPKIVDPGATITARGRNWGRRVSVRLLIGPPNSEADSVAIVRTNADGRFAKRIELSSEITVGDWVLLACRRQCRLKKTARFTVAATP